MRQRASGHDAIAARAMGLASEAIWEDTYLDAIKLPARPTDAMPWERCMRSALPQTAPATASDRVLEVGCAPGRWMAYYAERFGASVEGLEYTDFDVRQCRENMRLLGIDAAVHEGDLWTFQPQKPYDVVVSLGVVEHFTDLPAVFRRHMDFLAPRGLLLLGVPNFQGVNRVAQRICDAGWLSIHNLNAMGHNVWAETARECGASMIAHRYIGGFDPDMISMRRRGRYALAPFWWLRHRGVGDRPNSRWWSSYLLMTFARNKDAASVGSGVPRT